MDREGADKQERRLLYNAGKVDGEKALVLWLTGKELNDGGTTDAT